MRKIGTQNTQSEKEGHVAHRNLLEMFTLELNCAKHCVFSQKAGFYYAAVAVSVLFSALMVNQYVNSPLTFYGQVILAHL